MAKVNIRTILLAIIFLLILVVIALLIGNFTFSYLGANLYDDVITQSELTASGDTLIFTKGNDLSLHATTDNFNASSGNLTDTTNPSVRLIASSKTDYAEATYYAGIRIHENTYTYSSDVAEIILSVYDEKGTLLTTSSDDLEYVTVNGVSGFDITDKTGAFNIVVDHPISTTSSSIGTTHTWTFTLTFVNLETDQSINENATLDMEVVLQQDMIVIDENNVLITDVQYVSDVNADMENSNIIDFYETNLNSNITLSNTDSTSSITYAVTLYNPTLYDYYFNGVEYVLGDETYSNEDISFEITNIEKGDALGSKKSVTINITFYYTDGVLAENNTLKSLLNFKFDRNYMHRKVDFVDLVSDAEANPNVVLNGTGIDINEDSVNFNLDENPVNNIMVSGFEGDYANGFAIVLDFSTDYTNVDDEDASRYQLLFLSRTYAGNGFAAWYSSSNNHEIQHDLGGNGNRGFYNLSDYGRYLLISTIKNGFEKTIIINKNTNEIETMQTQGYNLSYIK